MSVIAAPRGKVIIPAGLAVLALAAVAGVAGAASNTGVALPTVVAAGFLDGLNPCAIAVLLIFISALLGSVERAAHIGAGNGAAIFAGGSSYIAGMYITYFALGAGLLGSVAFLQQSHLPARIAALIAIGLGLMALQEVLLPEWGQRLTMPARFHRRGNMLARRAGVASLFVAGGFIGLCTVPCSGSVYLATVALLSQQATYAAGLAYLALYNLMFVLPLVILLVSATSRPAYRLLVRAQLRARGGLKLVVGATTIGVGLLTMATL